MSQNSTEKSVRDLWYFDFRPECPRYMTYISHKTYLSSADKVSPWSAMPGWSLKNCFFDLLHTIYLGVGKDLVGNLLGDFVDCNMLVGENLEDQLRRFSMDMHKEFKHQKTLTFSSNCVFESPMFVL